MNQVTVSSFIDETGRTNIYPAISHSSSRQRNAVAPAKCKGLCIKKPFQSARISDNQWTIPNVTVSVPALRISQIPAAE
jgi:hypothetical protein